MRVSLVMLAFSVILVSIAFVSGKKLYLYASFETIDTNYDGVISSYELKTFYKKAGLNNEQIEAMFSQADYNGDFEIDLKEFENAFGDKEFPRGEEERKQVLRAMFKTIDIDQSGTLDVEELIKFYEKLGVPVVKEEVRSIFKDMDKEGDGQITAKEYEKYN